MEAELLPATWNASVFCGGILYISLPISLSSYIYEIQYLVAFLRRGESINMTHAVHHGCSAVHLVI